MIIILGPATPGSDVGVAAAEAAGCWGSSDLMNMVTLASDMFTSDGIGEDLLLLSLLLLLL